MFSFVLIAVVICAAGAGTYAYFTATRTTSANKFVTGTLDLDVSANGNKLEPFVVENIGESGDISGTKTWKVRNTGSLPGRLLVKLQNVANADNGCNDQEKNIEPTCEADDLGELGNVVVLNISVDGANIASSSLATANMADLGNKWSNVTPIIIPAGGEKTVVAYWSADETAYGNEIQSDSTKFDIDFRLVQQNRKQQEAN